jgi:hypothetical protein
MIHELEDQMAILGHIKIGGLRPVQIPNGIKLIPEQHDHFTVTTAQRNKRGYGYETDAELMNVLLEKDKTSKKDGKLRQIMVMLPTDDMNENLVTHLSIYDSDGRRCRGDGKEAQYINPTTGKLHKVHCPCQMLQARLSRNDDPDARPSHALNISPNPETGYVCKTNGHLRVLIAEAQTLGGIHLLRTTSSNSIKQLFASMRQIGIITGGAIANIPLLLTINPKRVRTAKSDQYKTVYVVNLVHKQSNLAEFLVQVAKQYRLHNQMKRHIAGESTPTFLPPLDPEDKSEQEEIAKEYWGISEDPKPTKETTNEVPDEVPDEVPVEKPTGTIPQIPLDQPVPLVLTTPPRDADQRLANLNLRRKYFTLSRQIGLKDTTIKGWMKNLWNTETTSELQIWQIMSMIEAIEKHIQQTTKAQKEKDAEETKIQE